METEKTMPSESSEEIQEPTPIPLDWDMSPTPCHPGPSDPVVPVVPPGFDIPPGFDVERPTVRRDKFKSSSIVPINATPISFGLWTPHKLGRGRKRKTPVSDEKTVTKKTRPKVSQLSRDLLLLSPSSNAMIEPRAHAEAILATFDALRRRLEQISETRPDMKAEMNMNANNLMANSTKRPDMKAEMIMNANNLMANRTKQIGPVPGVEVGDIFYFRMEMCVVGLHSLPMAGIDHMINGTNSIAVAIVSSGGYENKEDVVGKMVYTGQGGNGRKKEKRGDQKLEGANYAMDQSSIWKNPIRVIRSRKDQFFPSNKVYIYDGLYKIKKSWTDKSTKFQTFKHKLKKEPGQPDGFAVWKMTEEWKKEPSSRGTVLTFDLSSGVERIPVAVVNEVDDDPEPDNFKYVPGIMHDQTIRATDMVPAGCNCKKVCVPSGAYCFCASENGGWLPYSSSGLLIKWLPLLYECGPGCQCTINCRNRVTQRGVRLHFEIFRTENCGWGLRSWDPIRAGSFVCEFAGNYLVNPGRDNKELVPNEYLFSATKPGKKALKWNQGMELAMQGGENMSEDKCHKPEPEPEPELVLVPVIISAKDMGNVSRFINHSCDPNLFWQLVRHGHGADQYTHVMFFALKHIPPMTELTYDYNGSSTDSWGIGVGAKECLCGATNCKGHFG